jgi:hypothetical protein
VSTWVELVVDPDRWALSVADGRLSVRRGGLDDPGAVPHTDVGIPRQQAPHGRPLEQLVTATVTGAARLLACFTRTTGFSGRGEGRPTW